MNKALGIAAIVGGLAYSIISGGNALAQEKRPYPVPTVSATSAQSQYQPIKFGNDRTLTYEVSQKFPSTYDFKEAGPNIGKIYFGIGWFEVGGVLDGIKFSYSHTERTQDEVLVIKVLTLNKGGRAIKFVNEPPKTFMDHAYIDGVTVQLGSSNFYEGQVSTQPWEKLTLNERLHRIFREWEAKLNIGEVKTRAERLKKSPAELRESLDTFVK